MYMHMCVCACMCCVCMIQHGFIQYSLTSLKVTVMLVGAPSVPVFSRATATALVDRGFANTNMVALFFCMCVRVTRREGGREGGREERREGGRERSKLHNYKGVREREHNNILNLLGPLMLGDRRSHQSSLHPHLVLIDCYHLPTREVNRVVGVVQ